VISVDDSDGLEAAVAEIRQLKNVREALVARV